MKLQSMNLIDFMIKEYNVNFVSVSCDSARGRCPHPDHDDHKPSFYVKKGKNGTWNWTCYSCHTGARDLDSDHKNYGSDAIAFVQWMSDYRGSSHIYTFQEAASIIAKYLGLNISSDSSSSNIYSHEMKINSSVAKGCHKYLLTKKGHAYSYLTNRGLDEKDMADWLIGYNGDRIVFPFIDRNNNIIAFTMRVVGESNNGYKYVNSRTSAIFNKSSYLYGIDKVDSTKNYLIITEGQMDVIAAYKYNLINTVATSGTCFTEKHIEVLQRYYKNITKLIFIYDGDAAGNAGLKRSAAIGRKHGYMIETFKLKNGCDLFDFMMENKESGAENILLNSIPYFYEELKDTIEQYDTIILNFQTKAISKINKLLANTNSVEEKSMIKSFVSNRFNIQIGGEERDDYIETG